MADRCGTCKSHDPKRHWLFRAGQQDTVCPDAFHSPQPAATRPIVVTLCGSTRFYEAWQEAIYSETMAGRIVLSVGFYPHSAEFAHASHIGCTPEQKIALDVLHKQKIDMSDQILVLNVGGYIGESTASEIAHAKATGKLIRYLETAGAKAAETAAGDGEIRPPVTEAGAKSVKVGSGLQPLSEPAPSGEALPLAIESAKVNWMEATLYRHDGNQHGEEPDDAERLLDAAILAYGASEYERGREKERREPRA